MPPRLPGGAIVHTSRLRVGRSWLPCLAFRRPPVNTSRARRPESRWRRGWRSRGRWCRRGRW
eukprot:13932162-Alexandrium_andersonii.AAC.1